MDTSYVLTVFNKAPFLSEVLGAVARERQVTAGEIVIVDDGSTDDSPRILDEFASRHAEVTIIRQRNGGAAAATNAGLGQARCTWVRLVDGDDRIALGSTDLLRAALDDSGAGFGFGRFATYEPGEASPETADVGAPHEDLAYRRIDDPLRRMLISQPFVPSATLARREVIERILPLPEGCRSSQDFALGVKVAQVTPFVQLDRICCWIPRVAEGRISGSKSRMYSEVACFSAQFAKEQNWTASNRRLAIRRNAMRARNYARRHLSPNRARQFALIGLRVIGAWPVPLPFARVMAFVAATYNEALKDPDRFA